jgi:hypothetical protein
MTRLNKTEKGVRVFQLEGLILPNVYIFLSIECFFGKNKCLSPDYYGIKILGNSL